MNELYSSLCDLIIRPCRHQYNIYDLGSPFMDKFGKRSDFQLRNPRGLKIKCSYYQPNTQAGINHIDCIIYLHSLNGSRLQSCRFANNILQHKIAFANLDFSGSGKSQGQYVSLGYHQKQDVLVLIEYLYNTYRIKRFGLWGRSMGAVTALKFADTYFNDMKLDKKYKRQWKITSMVIDSPFSSLNKLAIQIAEKKINIPGFILRAGFLLIKNTVQEKANFKMSELEVCEFVGKITLPLLIFVSKQDQLISYTHGQQIYQKYGGQKQLIFLKGGHNQARDTDCVKQTLQFFIKHFKQKHKLLKTSLLFIKQNMHNFKSRQCAKSSENLQIFQSDKKIKRRTPSSSPIKKNQKIQLTKIELQKQDPIHLQQKDHFNIIYQKLNNMKKKINMIPGKQQNTPLSPLNSKVFSNMKYFLSNRNDHINEIQQRGLYSEKKQGEYYTIKQIDRINQNLLKKEQNKYNNDRIVQRWSLLKKQE